MLNRLFKKDSFRGIINYEKIIAKAQFRVGQCPKGIRLQENLTVLSNQATEASPERAEKKPYAAIAIGAKRWLKHPKNLIIFQWRGTPK